MCPHICVETQGGQRRVSDLLELELQGVSQVIVSHHIRAQGTELGSSIRAANVLNA